MKDKGKIIIKKTKKGLAGDVEIYGKEKTVTMSIPPDFQIKDMSLDGKECEVEREKGQITKIIVDNAELPKRQTKPAGSADKRYAQHHKKNSPHQKTPDEHRGKEKKIDLWKIENTILPQDTRKALSNNDIDNFHLKLNKAAQYIDDKKDDKKFEFYKTDRVQLNVKHVYSKIPIEELKKRQNDIVQKYKKNGYTVSSLSLKTDWRLVVGLGSGSVYETSMTLHHIYGIPYLPGSVIKGIVRSFIITEKFGMNDDDVSDIAKAEARALKDKTFCDIFGCPKENSHYNEARQGRVIFMDAFPNNIPTIEPDIINPHYADYYNEKSPPGDYLSPKPIPFLTVKDTSFNFNILAKEKHQYVLSQSEIDNKTIAEWLKKALTVHGIGAKTAVGYGYMKEAEG